MTDKRVYYKFAKMTGEGIVTGITNPGGIKTFWGEGVTQTVSPPTMVCAGLNDSDTIPGARGFVKGDVLLVVRHGGKVIVSDKNTCEWQTVVAAYDASDYDEATAPAQKAYDEATATAWKARDEAVRDVICTPDRLLFGDDDKNVQLRMERGSDVLWRNPSIS